MVNQAYAVNQKQEWTSNNNYAMRIGLFGVGLEAYWEQFASLQERMEGDWLPCFPWLKNKMAG